jgi:hypothetical protein
MGFILPQKVLRSRLTRVGNGWENGDSELGEETVRGPDQLIADMPCPTLYSIKDGLETATNEINKVKAEIIDLDRSSRILDTWLPAWRRHCSV